MISYTFPIWEGALAKKPEIITPHNFSIYQNSTGLIQQTRENKTIKNIVEGYSIDGYNFITKPPGFSDWSTKIGEKYKCFIKECVKSFKKLDVLEIGGGSEYFGIEAINNGVRSYTIVDPAIEKSSSKKIRIIKDYFGENTTFNKQFDLILSFNTIEHVPDPFDFLLGVRKNLKHNGIAILIYPDSENQFRKGDFNALLHEHLTYFTLLSSKMLFEKIGFNIKNHFSSEDTFYFCLQKSKTNSNENNCNQMQLLDRTKIAFDNSLKYFIKRIKYATQNGKVGLHGCCAGLNNLIFLSSINDDPNIFLFDGDISKKEKYISSTKKIIKHSIDPEYSNMDYIFIAAMTFYDEIKRFAVKYGGIDENRIFPIYPI